MNLAVGEVIFNLAVCKALDTALLIRLKGVTSVGLDVEEVVDGVGVLAVWLVEGYTIWPSNSQIDWKVVSRVSALYFEVVGPCK